MNFQKKQKLLFIQPGGLGDVIILSSILANLAEIYEVHLLVENRAFKGSQELLSDLAEVKVFDFKSKKAFFKFSELLSKIRNYTVIISSGSSPLISLLLFFSGAPRRIGYKSKLSFLLTDQINLNKNQYASFMLADLIKPLISNLSKEQIIPSLAINTSQRLIEEDYILIHPGISKLALQKGIIKSPKAVYWSELLHKLCQKHQDKQIVLIGGPDDMEIIAEINKNLQAKNFLNLSNKAFSLTELAALIKNSQTFICVDSAPLHLAVALRTKTIVLFGPTDPEKLIPPKQKNIQIVQVPNLLCQPCLWNRRQRACAKPICLDWQNPQAVLEKT